MDISGLAVLCAEARSGNLGFREHVGHQALQREQPSLIQIIFGLCDDVPQIIARYPEDPRGRSCLVRCIMESGRVLHICTGYPPNNWVITVYWPDLTPNEWDSDYMKRLT